jgi:hypothetical protein
VAALKTYSKKRDTHNSEDRYDGWWMRIYPKSIRYEYHGGVDPDFGYARHSSEYYVGGTRLQALLANFEVTSAKELVVKIATDEDAIVDDVTDWIARNCDAKG